MGGRLGKGFQGAGGSVWYGGRPLCPCRPLLRGALKAGGPPTATLHPPAGAKRLKAAGVCDFSGGRAGEGGLERSKGLFSQVPNPPLARLAGCVSYAQAALRSDCTAKDAAPGTSSPR